LNTRKISLEDASRDRPKQDTDLRLLVLAVASFILGLAWIVAVRLEWL